VCFNSGAAGSIETLAVGSRGGHWSLVSWHRAAEFEDATPDDKLRLGEERRSIEAQAVCVLVWHRAEASKRAQQAVSLPLLNHCRCPQALLGAGSFGRV
jgi:hypothetical protein